MCTYKWCFVRRFFTHWQPTEQTPLFYFLFFEVLMSLTGNMFLTTYCEEAVIAFNYRCCIMSCVLWTHYNVCRKRIRFTIHVFYTTNILESVYMNFTLKYFLWTNFILLRFKKKGTLSSCYKRILDLGKMFM